MKPTIRLGVAAVCLLMGLVVLAAAVPAAAGAPLELRLTHPADLTHPVHLAAERMVKRIAERTGGQVKISIFPNNALGAPPEAAQQVRLPGTGLRHGRSQRLRIPAEGGPVLAFVYVARHGGA